MVMENDKKMMRSDKITIEYFAFLDKHLAEIVSGKVTKMLELNQIANELCISAKHLSQTIQLTQGHHPCYFYDKKILEEAKKLLSKTNLSIADIAEKLTYDPSNFSKFFKKYVGQTPGQFRKKTKSD